MLTDFFKKEVTSYPSGGKSLGDKSRCGMYDRALAKAGMLVCSVAMAASLTGCAFGLSREEIDAMKAKVPEKQKKELVAKCDSILLAKMDSCYLAGGGKAPDTKQAIGVGIIVPVVSEKGDAVSNAVLNGYHAARAEITDALPSRDKRTGADYVVLDYMNECSAQAVRTKTDYEPCMTTEGMEMKLTETKLGRPEFYQTVASRVKARQAERAAFQTKIVQNGR